VSDRELVLGRVREALADVPASEALAFAEPDAGPEATYARSGERDAAARLALFARRAGDYRAEVTVCTPAGIAAAVATACARHDAHRLVVPEGLDRAWLPTAIEAVADHPPLAWPDLTGCDGVISGCELAIAVTGTVALATGPAQGRRAATLLPDLHVCVVRGEQIVETVPEAIDRLAAPIAAQRAITFVSGPSATSDIELRRVEGVHGPRRLELIVADPALASPSIERK
jgi:L-lactate dehydrogenase complex protein LldG